MEIQLRFYNSRTKKKEVFDKPKDKLITMYTCGPTVYNFAHIGNFRAYIFEDLLKRTIKFFGYKVKHVMNITDVEDKIIKSLKDSSKSLEEYTSYYINAFFEDIKTLNIEMADEYPKATEHIKEIVELIKNIEKKGYAYKGEDGSYYFSVKKFKRYGVLQPIDFSSLKEGVRINQDEYTKEFFGDFALWKSYEPDDGEVYWETELGKGRPGWHIECSVMCMKHLSNAFDNSHLHPEKFETIDIHCGGIDNLFPHHENEIAQTESVTDKRFVDFWMHCEHLNVEGKKMSKSLGNFYTLRDLLHLGYSPREIRYLLISVHYRQKLNFTLEGLNAARNTIKRIDDFVESLELKERKGEQHISKEIEELLESFLNNFKKGLADDLNISKSLASLFEMIKMVNKIESISEGEKKRIIDVLKEVDKVLGIIFFKPQKDNELSDEEIERLVNQRWEYKKNKDFKKADEIRDYLRNKGIELKDTKDKTIWKRLK